MALSRDAMRGLDEHLRRQQRARRLVESNTARWAKTAPMPTDPTICRWCGGRLRAVLEGDPVDYCQNGCLKADQDVYTGHCAECDREFKTGKPLMHAPLCHGCEQKLTGQIADAHTPPERQRQRYEYRTFGRGRWRD